MSIKKLAGRRALLLFLCSAFYILTSALPANAAPTIEDLSKSLHNSETSTIDGRQVLGVAAAVAGFVILVVLLNNRQERREIPKTLNHSGKLLRELMKSAGLKRAQITQLKLINQELASKDQPVESLVTLLLCPSLIKKARDRKAK